MSPRSQLVLRAMLLASGLPVAATVDAGHIWRVNYTQPAVTSMNGKVETHVLATEPSFGPSGANHWNETLPIPAVQSLLETSAAGGGAPIITFFGEATNSTSTGSPRAGEPIDDDLDKWAARFSGKIVAWHLQGLTPGASYDLVFYDADSQTASVTLTTEVDSDGDGVLDQGDTIAWDIGDDFSLFQNVQADAAGIIRGRWTGSSATFVDVAGFQVAESAAAPISIAVDVKPDSNENPINPGARGKIPVAILMTEDFDAGLVDVSTVQFGPGGAQPIHYARTDVDGDTDGDLILHFNAQQSGISCGEPEATLTGQTFGGALIVGTDSIRTVGCNQ